MNMDPSRHLKRDPGASAVISILVTGTEIEEFCSQNPTCCPPRGPPLPVNKEQVSQYCSAHSTCCSSFSAMFPSTAAPASTTSASINASSQSAGPTLTTATLGASSTPKVFTSGDIIRSPPTGDRASRSETSTSSSSSAMDDSSSTSSPTSTSSYFNTTPTISVLQSSSSPQSPSSTPSLNPESLSSKPHSKTPIVAGVVTAILLLLLAAAAAALYQRRRRLRDRREWERTHAEIADAVREVGAGAGSAQGTWNTFPREKGGDMDPLFASGKEGGPATHSPSDSI
ncbi:hypothetical protein FB451DRAFT_1179588 [Mycena latifolia]|nr:hypothetical protein FB451DRAFT_1179588 [Mycena latifolia]